MSYVGFMYFLVPSLFSINFIIGFVYFARQDTEEGRNFMICSVIVLLIGFSTCIGGASLIN
jgi:hypothetical protein